MAEMTPQDRMDRHGLVMAIWTPSAFIAVILIHKGMQADGNCWIGAGFVMLIAAFCCHVIANAVLKTGFSAGERAFGIFAFAVSLTAYFSTLFFGSKELVERMMLPVGIGLFAIVLVVLCYMVIAFGARGAFDRFDVIRNNNPRASSRLPHRGGRR